MAITPFSMELIAKASGKGRAASLGYPDLLLSRSVMSEFIGGKTISTREDSAKIAQWHNVQLDEIYESREFIKALGYEDLDVFDLKALRGEEIFMDLNQPLWPQYREKYSLVIDPGTCEHCFHVGQAIMNVAGMCEQGGYIVQGLPLNAYNHGFYSVSPTLVKDFYEDNGFEIQACFGVTRTRKFPVHMQKAFFNIPERAFMLVMVKRMEVKPLTVPTQGRYRGMLG